MEFAQMGLVPAGTQRNREFRSNMIEMANEISDDIMNILFDPQTSGGLLIAIAAENAVGLLQELHRHGVADAAIVGEILAEPKGKIVIRE
jgi:selenide,water dikinase